MTDLTPRPHDQSNNATLFGRPLPGGGTVGVCAPSSPYFSGSEVQRGIRWWESLGYRVRLAPDVSLRRGYVAGDAATRAAGIMAMFEDSSVHVVQVLRGGFGSAQTIPFIDFNVIAKNPKLFVGFSDTTALHVALSRKVGLVTVYGPGLVEVGKPGTSDLTRGRLVDVVTGGGVGPVPEDPDDPFVRTISPGVVTAPLVGGCLQLLIQTLGTPWEFDADGAILFFEDIDMPPWYVDGMLTQLHQARKLRGVVGVVVGEMVNCDWRRERPEWPQTKSLEDVLEEHLTPLKVPVLYRLPLGHGRHLASVPLGVPATLDATAGTLSTLRGACQQFSD